MKIEDRLAVRGERLASENILKAHTAHRSPLTKFIQKTKSENGQVLPLYALIVATMMMLWAFVINTGEIVSHKIKVQTAADLGAYAGASVMAYHMANDEEYLGALSDSIAELNTYLKGEYYNLISNISLAQCTTSGISGRGVNCSYYDRNGVFCDVSGYRARYDQIDGALTSYRTIVIPQVEARFMRILEESQKLAKKKVIETVKKNIPNISEEEIFVDMKDIANDFELFEKKFVTPSYYSYNLNPPQFTCYYETSPRTLSPIEVPYQIGIKPSFSGHVVVGILQKSFTEGVSHNDRNVDYKPSNRYMNWDKSFGKHRFPSFAAFSAAAPIRNLKTMRDEYELSLSDTLTGVTDYLRHVEPANVNASHVQDNLTLPNEKYYDYESLMFPNPGLAVWFIPLAKEKFIREEIGGVENNYYGEGNPFKGKLSQAIFTHDFNLGIGSPKQGFPAMYREAFRNKLQGAQDAYKLFLH